MPRSSWVKQPVTSQSSLGSYAPNYGLVWSMGYNDKLNYNMGRYVWYLLYNENVSQ